jgi:hypothetical protein
MTQSKDIGNYVLYTDGKIWSKTKKDWLIPQINKDGYLRIGMGKKKYYMQRVIAQAFLLNTLNLPAVDHINNNKQDNRIENLQWISRSGNVKKAYTDGIMDKKGILHGRSKLTEDQVKEIRYNHPTLSTRQLGKIYGVGSVTIGKIRNRLLWSHI